MRDRTSKVIHAHLRDADPLRGIATAEVDSVCFFLEQNLVDRSVEVRRHGDHNAIGKVAVERRGGTILFRGERVADYVYEPVRGYTVYPLCDGKQQIRDAVAEHPIDFLIRHAKANR